MEYHIQGYHNCSDSEYRLHKLFASKGIDIDQVKKMLISLEKIILCSDNVENEDQVIQGFKSLFTDSIARITSNDDNNLKILRHNINIDINDEEDIKRFIIENKQLMISYIKDIKHDNNTNTNHHHQVLNLEKEHHSYSTRSRSNSFDRFLSLDEDEEEEEDEVKEKTILAVEEEEEEVRMALDHSDAGNKELHHDDDNTEHHQNQQEQQEGRNRLSYEEEEVEEENNDGDEKEEDDDNDDHYRRRRLLKDDKGNDENKQNGKKCLEINKASSGLGGIKDSLMKARGDELKFSQEKPLPPPLKTKDYLRLSPLGCNKVSNDKKLRRNDNISSTYMNNIPQVNYAIYNQYGMPFPYGYFGSNLPQYVSNMPIFNYHHNTTTNMMDLHNFSSKPLPPPLLNNLEDVVNVSGLSSIGGGDKTRSSPLSDVHKKIKLTCDNYVNTVVVNDNFMVLNNTKTTNEKSQGRRPLPPSLSPSRSLNLSSSFENVVMMSLEENDIKQHDKGDNKYDDPSYVYIENLPKMNNNVEFLNKIFKKFGMIINIQTNLAKNSAKIQFKQSSEAYNAAKFYQKSDIKFNVFGNNHHNIRIINTQISNQEHHDNKVLPPIKGKDINNSHDENDVCVKGIKSNNGSINSKDKPVIINKMNVSVKLTNSLRNFIEEKNKACKLNDAKNQSLYEEKIKKLKNCISQWNNTQNYDEIKPTLQQLHIDM